MNPLPCYSWADRVIYSTLLSTDFGWSARIIPNQYVRLECAESFSKGFIKFSFSSLSCLCLSLLNALNQTKVLIFHWALVWFSARPLRNNFIWKKIYIYLACHCLLNDPYNSYKNNWNEIRKRSHKSFYSWITLHTDWFNLGSIHQLLHWTRHMTLWWRRLFFKRHFQFVIIKGEGSVMVIIEILFIYLYQSIFKSSAAGHLFHYNNLHPSLLLQPVKVLSNIEHSFTGIQLHPLTYFWQMD